MSVKKTEQSNTASELPHILAQDEEFQRYLFQMFTLIALTFLLVYGCLQAKAGLMVLAALYIGAAVVIAINSWAIRFHNKLVIAANVFAALGPVVLLPWQVSGGVAGTGLMWFPVYVIFIMFFVPGKGGSFWVMSLYGASFFLLLLQLQGVVAFPFEQEVMFHFYFVGCITYALAFYFLHTQRIVTELLKMHLISQKSAEGAARIGTWSWDLKANTIQWCDQLYDIFGLDPDKKVTYESYLKLIHPSDRQVTRETVQEALTDHQPYSLIHRIKRPDGSDVWVHSLGEVMVDSRGKPVGMFGTAQDITERMTKDSKHVNKVSPKLE